jgi:Tol biopolymer transport system component
VCVNLVFGDTNDTCDIFVRDRLFGTTEIVSLSSAGELANDGSTGGPTISDDGRFVAFSSVASNLVPGDANTTYDVFLRDRVSGTTARVSEAMGGGDANDASDEASVSEPRGRGRERRVRRLPARRRHRRDDAGQRLERGRRGRWHERCPVAER